MTPADRFLSYCKKRACHIFHLYSKCTIFSKTFNMGLAAPGTNTL